MVKIFISLFFVLFSLTAYSLEFSSKPVEGFVDIPKDDNTLILTKHNLVTLRGEIDGPLVSATILALNEVKSKEPILYIISPGGSVIAGNQLIQYILNSPKKITCIADIAASMAFTITQACHVRVVSDFSILMQHQARWEIEGQTENIKSNYGFSLRLLEVLEKAQADRIGITLEEFRKNILSDWWIFGADAIKANVADVIKVVRCEFDLSQETVITEEMTWFGPVAVTYSKCPLARSPLKIDYKGIYEAEKKKLIWDDMTSIKLKVEKKINPIKKEEEREYPADYP